MHYTTRQNLVIRRDDIGTIKATDRSTAYWTGEASRIFRQRPDVQAVEVVFTGRSTDSAVLRRGNTQAPRGWYVIIAATPGRYGRSRRDYAPALNEAPTAPLEEVANA
jgi:hypothetical protein